MFRSAESIRRLFGTAKVLFAATGMMLLDIERFQWLQGDEVEHAKPEKPTGCSAILFLVFSTCFGAGLIPS